MKTDNLNREDPDMRLFRLFLAAVLAAALCFTAPAACAEALPADPVGPEPNTEYRTDLYPWVVHSPSADLYISAADIEAFGLEALCDDLPQVVADLELDYADARTLLAPYLKGDVPVIRICTDFCNHAERSRNDDAYYNQTGNFIKLFFNWNTAKRLLLHEYVHYLTFTCAETPVRYGFWSEGIAEYVSRFVCRNRLTRSMDLGYTEEQTAELMRRGLLDPLDGTADGKRVYLYNAELFLRGYFVGISYNAASNDIIQRTEAIQQNPKPDQLSYYEAGSMTAWLCETFGEDYVLSRWNTDPEHMEEAFGQSFPDLYRTWAEWNAKQCDQLGIDIESPNN